MKLSQLQKELTTRDIDAAVLNSQDSNFRYLAGLEEAPEQGMLVVPAQKNPVLVIRGFEAKRFRELTPILVVEGGISKILAGVETVGLNYSQIPVAQAKKYGKGKKKKDIGPVLAKLRQQKTAEELRRIRKANRMTADIFEECFATFKRFRTEGDVKRFMETMAEDLGCGLAFPAIVGSGKNGAVPHYQGNEKLRRGFCVIDFGVKWKGYCSDVTRTIYLGRPGKKEKEYYAAVLAAQETALAAVKAGVKASSVDALARKRLGKLAKQFIHGLGHQLGVDVHEGEVSLSPRSKKTLEENMVVTVEPGIYFPGKFGIRIEDDVLVQKKKAVVLTGITKELMTIRS